MDPEVLNRISIGKDGKEIYTNTNIWANIWMNESILGRNNISLNKNINQRKIC